jgi:hypothetical protein
VRQAPRAGCLTFATRSTSLSGDVVRLLSGKVGRRRGVASRAKTDGRQRHDELICLAKLATAFDDCCQVALQRYAYAFDVWIPAAGRLALCSADPPKIDRAPLALL